MKPQRKSRSPNPEEYGRPHVTQTTTRVVSPMPGGGVPTTTTTTTTRIAHPPTTVSTTVRPSNRHSIGCAELSDYPPASVRVPHPVNKQPIARKRANSQQTDRPTFIIASDSFKDMNYLAPNFDNDCTPKCDETHKPLLDRARIVKQEVLLDGNTFTKYYEVGSGSLGKGSYGSVVKAKDIRTGITRAVKVVTKAKIENLTRLKREILIMKKLDHPHIIKLFEVYEDATNLFLVMELCTGGELFDRVIKSGHFNERYAASLMRQIFSAMSYCHTNAIMHRDLKPENLLYVDPGPVSALKVIDWGFAARCGKNHKFSSVVGTPYYVAPEVLFGNYDKSCDIWSAGVILYILLCGYPPFHGKDNQEILKRVKTGEFSYDPRHWKRVSEQAKHLVSSCLMYDPRKRLTAQESLQHKWIQYYAQTAATTENLLNTKLGSDLLEKFKSFQRFNKMKKLAVTCVAYQMNERDIGALHDIFSALDKNGDGVLSVHEIQSGLQKMTIKVTDEVQKLLQELDTDANGTIDYTEFIAASLDHKICEQENVCMAAFKVFDIDGDGRITLDELHQVLKINFVEECLTRETIEEMMKEVDTNNDGIIDFDEFMRMMRGQQKKKIEVASTLSKARALLYRRLD